MTMRIRTNHHLCSGCRACSTACSITHLGKADPARGAIQILGDGHSGYEYQVVCRLCEEADCVTACMAAALERDPASGRILYDRDRCVGCWMCLMVCAYHAIVRDEATGKVIRCDQCEDRDSPACEAVCSTGAIAFAE
jgi:carbon-monoxide dehydrogenase iron sulfur subunit